METKLSQTIAREQLSRRDFLKLGVAGLIGATGVGALATGCAPATPTPAPETPVVPTPTVVPTLTKEEKILTIAWGLDPNSLDPTGQNSRVENNLSLHLFDSLLYMDPQGNLHPMLAESWSNPEPLIFRFNLRKGVKFHNGDPFDAECVKFTYERIYDPDVTSRLLSMFTMVDKVEIIDDYTVDLVLKEPAPLFLKYIAAYFYQHSPRYVESVGNETAGVKPVGTGAYRFVEWVKGDHLTIERNPDYWGSAPKIDRLNWVSLPEGASRVAALETGEADVILDVDPTAAKSLQDKPGLETKSVPSYRGLCIYLNHLIDTPMAGPVDEKSRKVRWAMNHAIDKEALCRDILEGHGTPLPGQPIPHMYFGTYPEAKMVPYDPDKAKELLAEAGYPNGFEIDMATTFGRYLKDKELSEATAGMFAGVGIKVNVMVQEWGEFQRRNFAHEQLPLYQVGNAVPSMDSLEFYRAIYAGDGVVSHHKNPDFDEISYKASVEMDTERRKELQEQCGRFLYENAISIWMHQQHDIYGFGSKVRGFEPRANQELDFRVVDVG